MRIRLFAQSYTGNLSFCRVEQIPSGCLRGDRFVGEKGQRATAALTTQAALAWSATLGFLGLVRLLTLRRRQAGIVRCLRRFTEPCFKFSDPPLGYLKAPPQRPNQGILLCVAQVVEIGKLRHALG